MEVIPLDATLVKGSQGRVTDRSGDGPIFMTTEPSLIDAPVVAPEDIHDLLLKHPIQSKPHAPEESQSVS